MLRPATVLAAQVTTIVAAGAIAWTSVQDPDLGLRLLGAAYVVLGLLALGAVYRATRGSGSAPPMRCHACGVDLARFPTVGFCHACGHHDPRA